MKIGAVARMVVALVVVGALATPAVAAANPSIPGSTTSDGLIWLPSYGEGSVQGIDPETKQVVVTIPGVADHPLVAKSNSDQTLLFVNSFGPLTWNVSVVDVASRSVIKRIPTLGAPWAVTAMSHDLRYLYVPTQLSVVQVIDTHTLDVVRTLPIYFPPGGAAHLEVSKDNKSIYVLSGAGILTKYDAETAAVQAPPLFVLGFVPGWGALSADGDTLYAVNYLAGITAVDTQDWYVVRMIPDGLLSGPISATLSPDGSTMWVCNFGDNTILVLDPHTGHLIRKIHTNGAPVYAGFSADGTKAYVSNLGPGSNVPEILQPFKFTLAYFPPLNTQGSTLDIYDTATGTITDQIKVASAPIAGVYPG
jgi:YVTN family beta-propeller protein